MQHLGKTLGRMHASNRSYVPHSPKHLILALRTTLKQLESTFPANADRVNFAELKRILNQRITELEECAEARLASLPLLKPKPAADI